LVPKSSLDSASLHKNHREHNGKIIAFNLQPQGAAVAIELPHNSGTSIAITTEAADPNVTDARTVQ